MGVRIRQKKKGVNEPWWIFVSHKNQRTSMLIGDKQAASAVASEVRIKLALGYDISNIRALNSYQCSFKIGVPFELSKHLTKGELYTFCCQVCGIEWCQKYKGGKQLQVCHACRIIDQRFTRFDFARYSYVDLEDLPLLQCTLYCRKGSPRQYIRLRMYFRGYAQHIFYKKMPSEEMARLLAGEIARANDLTHLCNLLMQLARKLSHRSWLDAFYRQYAKHLGFSDYNRFKLLPRYVRQAEALRTFTNEIKKLERRIKDGAYRGRNQGDSSTDEAL